MSASGSSAPDPARVFLPGFEALGAPYMVTGGVGAIVYGEVRMTNDIDFVLSFRLHDASRLARVFDPVVFYVPPVETLREEATRPRHGHFNLIHLESNLRADVYLAGEDPLQAWGLARRQRRRLGGTEGWVAAPEYIILQKLLYFRAGGSDRHLRDIAWMLRVSEGLIDLPLLEAKVAELGVEREWGLAQMQPLDG